MTVAIKVDDKLLFDALNVMLLELGYAVSDGVYDTVITDNPELTDNGSNVLYVGYKNESKEHSYLCRPFSLNSLDAALKVFNVKDGAYKPDISLDKKHCEAVVFGCIIPLTEKEMLLFSLLLENKNSAVSDKKILEYVWKNDISQGSNIVAVYIKYLRQKIDERVGQRLIFRVRGEGYMLKINEKE